MSWHDVIIAHLPPPEDEGQADLRQDIVDELGDHLSCAMQRELRKTNDQRAARRAVLARFGNVKRIACRLWFDAMKETIMNQRIAMISNTVLAAACIAVCVIAFLAMRQNNRIAEALIAKIEAMGGEEDATAAAPSVWAEANVTVVRGSPDGEPVEGLSVFLSGQMFNDGTIDGVAERTDAEGVASFGLVRPGGYTASIRGPSGLSNARRIIFHPGKQEPKPIVWPDDPVISAPVSFAVEMPEFLEGRIAYLHCRFEPRLDDLQELKGTWQRPPMDVLLTPDRRVWVFSADEFDSVWEDLPGDNLRLKQNALHLRDELTMNAALEYQLARVTALLPVADADEPEVFIRFDWSDAQRELNRDRRPRISQRPEPEPPIIEHIYRARPDQENVWRIEMPDWLIDGLERKFAAEDETSESEP